MKPFFFGESAAPLYGVYHPPLVSPARKEAVLLCAPFGQEYMRSHRAYRQLALLLSKKGYPVLRFDYRGTGDSGLDPEQVTTEDWIQDIRVAAEELKHMSQASNLCLVGLRMGALLAAEAIKRHPDELNADRLVLWDPVLSGKDYVEEIRSTIGAIGPSPTNCIDQENTLHYNGFPMLATFREILNRYDLRSEIPGIRKLLHVVASETESSQALKRLWSQYASYAFALRECPGNWNFVDEFGGILLPQPVIQEIVNWITTGE
ncbi:MAG: hypothetical protein C9356_01980 [Oleiphilus sp.]|nr:MAG: hypothetical protein C9356_01980 [Oleiphilus sp.]